MDGEGFMKGKRGSSQRGMFSIFGVCALGTLMIFSAALYAVGSSHTGSAKRYLARNALRNTAEDGIRLAVRRMNADPAAMTDAENAVSKHIKLLEGTSGDAGYTVYARHVDGMVLLLSVGEQGDEKIRAVGAARKKDGSYIIDHWEY